MRSCSSLGGGGGGGGGGVSDLIYPLHTHWPPLQLAASAGCHLLAELPAIDLDSRRPVAVDGVAVANPPRRRGASRQKKATHKRKTHRPRATSSILAAIIPAGR